MLHGRMRDRMTSTYRPKNTHARRSPFRQRKILHIDGKPRNKERELDCIHGRKRIDTDLRPRQIPSQRATRHLPNARYSREHIRLVHFGSIHAREYKRIKNETPTSTTSRYGAPTHLRDRDLLLDGAPLQESTHDSLAPDPECPECSGRAELGRAENDHLAFRDAVEPAQTSSKINCTWR